MATPFPFVDGEVLTAAQLNSIGEAWTSYTPTVTQGVGVTATVVTARYTEVNKVVFVQVFLTFTSSGTASNQIIISAPVTSSAAATDGNFGGAVGAGGFFKSATTVETNVTVNLRNTTTFWFNANGTAVNVLGVTPTFNIVNTDFCFFQATYEAA
jgi:hypothetical protein